MNMPERPGAAGRTLVTIARAAELLTASGDQITAPNVSRYVERWKELIWSEKRGRERLVDLTELIEHRRTNVQVADKQSARGVQPLLPTPAVPSPAAPQTPASPVALTEDDPEGVEPGSLGDLNLALKKLELRKRQREEDLADGSVIGADEVLELISTTLGAMITSFEQQEPIIAQRFGREIAAAFRKSRKDAQLQAGRVLKDLAQKLLPENLIAAANEAATIATQEIAPETPAIE